MFDRFDDHTRKLMSRAREEALRLRHDFIGPEHLLLGLVQEGSGLACTALENLDVDLGSIREETERRVEAGAADTSPGQLPFTNDARRVLELTLEEARDLGHSRLGTEHVLLGLLRQEQGIAWEVLQGLGVAVEDVRREIRDLGGTEP